MIKYFIEPNATWVSGDGDIHKIGQRRLMHLWGVSPKECTTTMRGLRKDVVLIHLGASADYNLEERVNAFNEQQTKEIKIEHRVFVQNIPVVDVAAQLDVSLEEVLHIANRVAHLYRG